MGFCDLLPEVDLRQLRTVAGDNSSVSLLPLLGCCFGSVCSQRYTPQHVENVRID